MSGGTMLNSWQFKNIVLLLGVALGIAAGVFIVHLISTRHSRVLPLPLIQVTSSAPPGAQPPDVRGPVNAPVTMEVFSDFQCPPCGSLYRTLKLIEPKYPQQLKVVYRHFPLEGLHKNALEASRAAEAAGVQGRFWAMHDLLFEHQEEWSSSAPVRPIFVAYARALRLDLDRFERDIDSEQVNRRISADRKRGESLRVPGTPIVVINQHEVSPEAVTYEGLRAATEAQLKRSVLVRNSKPGDSSAGRCRGGAYASEPCAAPAP